MLALPSPGVATRLAGAAAQPVNVAAQSSDAQTPVSTVAERHKDEPTAQFIITGPRIPNSVGVPRVSGGDRCRAPTDDLEVSLVQNLHFYACAMRQLRCLQPTIAVRKRRGRDSNPRYRGYPHNSFVVIEGDRVCCGKRAFPLVCLRFRSAWALVGMVLGTRGGCAASR